MGRIVVGPAGHDGPWKRSRSRWGLTATVSMPRVSETRCSTRAIGIGSSSFGQCSPVRAPADVLVVRHGAGGAADRMARLRTPTDRRTEQTARARNQRRIERRRQERRHRGAAVGERGAASRSSSRSSRISSAPYDVSPRPRTRSSRRRPGRGSSSHLSRGRARPAGGRSRSGRRERAVVQRTRRWIGNRGRNAQPAARRRNARARGGNGRCRRRCFSSQMTSVAESTLAQIEFR